MKNTQWFDTDEAKDKACRDLLATGTVAEGVEGHEFWRRFGEVHPRQSPAMFSNVRSLERQLEA